MPAFEYEALDLSGRSRRGLVTAETLRSARQELRRQRLTPVAINAASANKTGLLTRRAKPARIKNGQLVNITRQLSVLVGAGTPLEEALGAVGLQAEDESVRKRLLFVRERVTEGWRFADALSEDKRSFPDLYRAVVRAGEISGDLAPVLDRLAGMLEKNRSMRSKVIGSMVYPIALFVFTGGIVTALMTYVVPPIIAQFEVFDAQLPLITRIVVAISEFLGKNGIYLILLAVAAVILFWQAMRRPALKRSFDRQILRTPILGRLLRSLEGARFARTLSTLVAGGAPLLDSLAGARSVVENAFMRERLDGAISMVREGTSLTGALKRANVLPPMMTHMVAAGERAGAVPQLLDKAATQLEEEFDMASNVALRLLEPGVIIVMGGVVALIVLSILLPMLQINSLAGG
jgi:general secretion pathway protein F